MKFKTKNEVCEYLKKNFYTNDSFNHFAETHTRKEIAEILRMLYPFQQERVKYKDNKAFGSMCKTRQCLHIEHWIMVHLSGCLD